jgi:hypothetical protein
MKPGHQSPNINTEWQVLGWNCREWLQITRGNERDLSLSERRRRQCWSSRCKAVWSCRQISTFLGKHTAIFRAEGSVFLLNPGIYLQVHKTLKPGRPTSAYTGEDRTMNQDIVDGLKTEPALTLWCWQNAGPPTPMIWRSTWVSCHIYASVVIFWWQVSTHSIRDGGV